MSSCHCHNHGEEEEEDDHGYYELNNYDEFNGYNAEDEGDDRVEDEGACVAVTAEDEDACAYEDAGACAYEAVTVYDDRPEVGNDTDTELDVHDYDGYNEEYVRLYEADADNRSQLRDEFIYTQVFNNHNIPTETSMDFSLGSMEEWGLTCSTFNNAEKGLMFATIYIVYDRLVCNNIHPFQEMNNLTDLFHSHIIHD
jgi:hypothetical protein